MRALSKTNHSGCLLALLLLSVPGSTGTLAQAPDRQSLQVRPWDGAVELANSPDPVVTAAPSVLAQPLRDAAHLRGSGRSDWIHAAGLVPEQVNGDRVAVEIGIDTSASARVTADLRMLGMQIDGVFDARVEGELPVSALEAAAQVEGVGRVAPQRVAQLHTGASTSQGVSSGRIDRWHAASIDGTGVTVAVIDSFDGLPVVTALQASGDWPGDQKLTLVDMHANGFGFYAAEHGMATLETAFDVAPGAAFVAYDVRLVSQWRDAIYHATDVQGADVISTSLGAPLDGVGDGSALAGSIAEAVEHARANGVLVVNAAGNSRQSHWGGLFDSSGIDPDGNGAGTDGHVFSGATTINCLGPTADECYCFPSGYPIQVELFWNDWTNVDRDYDLRILRRRTNGNWAGVALSNLPQTGAPGQAPQELISYSTVAGPAENYCGGNTTVFGVQVVTSDIDVGDGENNLQLFTSWPLRISLPSRSLGFPADSPALVAVSAVDADTFQHEAYSSEGPILATGGGLPLGGEIHKPDVASFANLDTETYGPGAFDGTSAAAPHVAGMAALLIQRLGGPDVVDVDALHSALVEIASTGSNDLGFPGNDFQSGFGRLRFQVESSLQLEDQPVDTLTGVPMLPPPSVSLRDDEGELVLHGLVDFVDLAFAVDPSGGAAALGGAVAQTTDGLSTFDALTVDVAGAGYVLGANAQTLGAEMLASLDSDAFDVHQSGVASVRFGAQPSSGMAGEPVSPVIAVEVLDHFDEVITTDSSTEITLSLESNPGNTEVSGTLVASVVEGVAVFAGLHIDVAADNYTLRATSDSGVFAVSDAFDIAAAQAAVLTFSQQPSNGVAGEPIDPVVSVLVLDAFGNPVADDSVVEVALFSNPADAVLLGATSAATVNGFAAFPDLVLDAAAMGYTLEAGSGSAAALSQPFDIAAAAPAAITFLVQPSDVQAGVAISPAVVLQVEDVYGNPVEQSVDVGMALHGNPTGASLLGTSIGVTNDGSVSFPGLTLQVAANGYTLQASSDGLLANSAAFAVLPGEATSLVFTQQPSSGVAGEPIDPAVAVLVSDAFGNAIADDSSVTVALSSNPMGGVLAGTTIAPTVDGLAMFPDLVLDTAANGYTLEANSGIAVAVSHSFDLGAATPAVLRFLAQPSTIHAGIAMSPAVEVVVEDVYGNLALADNESAVLLSLEENPGEAQLSGAGPVTAVGGSAVFDTLSVNLPGAGYVLRAEAGSLQGATSVAFVVTVGAGPQPSGVFKDGFEHPQQ